MRYSTLEDLQPAPCAEFWMHCRAPASSGRALHPAANKIDTSAYELRGGEVVMPETPDFGLRLSWTISVDILTDAEQNALGIGRMSSDSY